MELSEIVNNTNRSTWIKKQERQKGENYGWGVVTTHRKEKRYSVGRMKRKLTKGIKNIFSFLSPFTTPTLASVIYFMKSTAMIFFNNIFILTFGTESEWKRKNSKAKKSHVRKKQLPWKCIEGKKIWTLWTHAMREKEPKSCRNKKLYSWNGRMKNWWVKNLPLTCQFN